MRPRHPDGNQDLLPVAVMHKLTPHSPDQDPS